MQRADVDKANRWFTKYGTWSVLLGRVIPVVRSLISIPAGFNRMNFMQFSLWTFVGSAIWNTILVTAGYMLGDQWCSILGVLNVFEDVIIVVATGSTTRRLPCNTSAHACCTPCESVEQRSNRSIAAKVSGGWANCSSCALALASSSPARVNACANAWFFACRRSFNCARFSCSSIAPRFP